MSSRRRSLIDYWRMMVEIARPDLRGWYRVVRKGRVTRVYQTASRYRCDVQPTRNDETDDLTQPVLTEVEIPVLWAGPQRGIYCLPTVGARVGIGYYDGDPSWPYIDHVRDYGYATPAAALGELLMQQEDGSLVKIDASGNVLVKVKAGKLIQLQTGGTALGAQDGMVTGITTCSHTGMPHTDVSLTVQATGPRGA